MQARILGANITYNDFVNQILKKRFNKTLYEWREDVVRPKLLMAKLCRDRVKITAEDVQKGFEAYYGEKVECRIIMWPADEKRAADKQYAEIRKSDEEFDRAARTQGNSTLASAGGRMSPFGRNTTGSEALERAAFSLRPGELSELIGTPEGYIVVKCVKRIPPDTSKKFEDVRATLEKEIFDKKLALEVPKVFAEMRKEAAPNLFLKKFTTEEDLVREVEKDLATVPGLPGRASAKAPQGN